MTESEHIDPRFTAAHYQDGRDLIVQTDSHAPPVGVTEASQTHAPCREWLLYEHDDGRYAVAPSAEAATFTKGEPAWHRVGPVEIDTETRDDDLWDAAQRKLKAGETLTKHEANAYFAAGLFNPINQVYFRAGLIACREYMARFVEAQSPEIAASIRANWWPAKLGEDMGPPRLMRWDELTEGEYGTADFKVKEGAISPTLEALPIAHLFLQTANEPPSDTVFRMPLTEQPAGVRASDQSQGEKS